MAEERIGALERSARRYLRLFYRYHIRWVRFRRIEDRRYRFYYLVRYHEARSEADRLRLDAIEEEIDASPKPLPPEATREFRTRLYRIGGRLLHSEASLERIRALAEPREWRLPRRVRRIVGYTYLADYVAEVLRRVREHIAVYRKCLEKLRVPPPKVRLVETAPMDYELERPRYRLIEVEPLVDLAAMSVEEQRAWLQELVREVDERYSVEEGMKTADGVTTPGIIGEGMTVTVEPSDVYEGLAEPVAYLIRWDYDYVRDEPPGRMKKPTVIIDLVNGRWYALEKDTTTDRETGELRDATPPEKSGQAGRVARLLSVFTNKVVSRRVTIPFEEIPDEDKPFIEAELAARGKR